MPGWNLADLFGSVSPPFAVTKTLCCKAPAASRGGRSNAAPAISARGCWSRARRTRGRWRSTPTIIPPSWRRCTPPSRRARAGERQLPLPRGGAALSVRQRRHRDRGRAPGFRPAPCQGDRRPAEDQRRARGRGGHARHRGAAGGAGLRDGRGDGSPRARGAAQRRRL